MPSKFQILMYAALLSCLTARADIRCDSSMTASIHFTQLLVGSIRVDKPGLARVYAADGSEFTGGQALWMQGQMLSIEKACAGGDPGSAAERLAQVQALIAAHTRR
jgi:hypothetical protein